MNAGRPLRILHLEDSADDAELIRERLIAAGLSVQLDWAGNEEEFTSFLRHGGYDLILADYRLPGFDAPAALLLTRSLCPGIPFIAVTGAVGDEKAVELLKQGATDYVLKDRLVKLPRVIERALGEVREQQARRQAEEALHRLNRELQAISTCNQILMRADDEQSLVNDICNIVCDKAGYRMAWVGYAENDEAKTIRPVAWAGTEDGYLEQARLTWNSTERGRGPAGTAIRSGKSACIQDFAVDPQAAPWRDSALQRGYRSCLSLALKDDDANTFGVFIIYSTQPNAFTPNEIRLLEELAGDLAFGILVLRARTNLKRAEQERQARFRFIESMDRVNRAIQGANDLDRMMSDVLDAVLSIFDCDRACLVYPCDPEAASWRVPMERNRLEYPGALVQGLEVPVDPDVVRVFRTVLASSSPVPFGPSSEHPLPTQVAKQFNEQSQIAMAIYPKRDKPYMFVLHQCSYPRIWTPDEEKLLHSWPI